jgi:ABC-type polysaccharide/polyol phosphate export permease
MAVAPAKLGDLWLSRELLRNLVAKELKVRYKGSFLGFAWSLLTPLLMTGIFTVVFAQFLRIGVQDFATLFLSGYLAWQFFSNSVNASVGAIVGNGPLIRKVYFPREVLPLALVASQAVHLLLALLATAPLFFVQRGNVVPYLPALAVGILLLSLFTAGVSMIFAAGNVGFRDLQELVQVIFLAWFYATPIIYPLFFVVENAPRFLPVILLNPMTWYVRLFQSALYGNPLNPGASTLPGWPSGTTFAVCTVAAVVTFAIGYLLFHRLAVTFAKEV